MCGIGGGNAGLHNAHRDHNMLRARSILRRRSAARAFTFR
jgi:hypothetical protein